MVSRSVVLCIRWLGTPAGHYNGPQTDDSVNTNRADAITNPLSIIFSLMNNFPPFSPPQIKQPQSRKRWRHDHPSHTPTKKKVDRGPISAAVSVLFCCPLTKRVASEPPLESECGPVTAEWTFQLLVVGKREIEYYTSIERDQKVVSFFLFWWEEMKR